MSNPYDVLGLPIDADDAAIRKRYLELVKQFPPEHHGERFKAIRAAFEELRDLEKRVYRRVFSSRTSDTLDAIVEAIAAQTPNHRPGLASLLHAIR